jgi:hypothetical protein
MKVNIIETHHFITPNADGIGLMNQDTSIRIIQLSGKIGDDEIQINSEKFNADDSASRRASLTELCKKLLEIVHPSAPPKSK